MKKVLLIDDDPDILHMYTLKFSLLDDCELITANTPDLGFRLAGKLNPDLILLDLIMPKSGGLPPSLNKEVGFQVLQELKNSDNTKDIPVVILTNLDEQNQGNVERARKMGATDYWVKAHYQPAEVLQKIRKIL